MAIADEFALVVGTIERTLGVYRREASARPDNGSPVLCHHVLSLCAAVENHLARIRADFAGALDPAVESTCLSHAQAVLVWLRGEQGAITWLRSADRSPLDLGTRYYVDGIARQIVSQQVEVTVVAVDDISYATFSNPFLPMLASWATPPPPGAPTIVVVFIPKREERSGLLHPLIVHELGHAADAERKVVERLMTTARSDQPFEDGFQRAAGDLAAASDTTPRQAGDTLAGRLESWCAEAFCDALATLILGPTYLYAFASEVSAGDLDTAAPRHPPPNARVGAMLDLLDTNGWAARMQAADPALDAWLRAHASAGGTYGPADRYLLEALTSLQPAVNSAAASELGSAPFMPTPDLDEVQELLDAGIPPAQLGDRRAAPREAIILADWWAAIAQGGGGTRGLALAPETPELADLLPAALELAAVTAAWATT